MNCAFVSDASAGAHPAVLDALARANALGHVLPYGDDPLTARALGRIRDAFGADAEALLVFNGTGANVLALGALLAPYEAVVCAASAHINEDECGAPERYLGVKLLTVATDDGKLTPDLIDRFLGRLGVQRAVQPKVVSISQVTELGTCYWPDELVALRAHARARGLRVHVDGARLANAAARLDAGLAEAAAGADAVSLGFTKNGGLYADAVVFPAGDPPPGLVHGHEQAMQVASKMRFLAAQVDALLSDDLWRRNATHANAMAARLAERIEAIPGVAVTRPVEANSVFFTLPAPAREEVERSHQLLLWDAAIDEVRCTCAWDTSPEAVDELATAIARPQ